MSDAALRELERRWRASGDPADEARFLAERLRAGELTRERLELAAFVGHVGARVALGDGAPAGRVPLRRWVAGLDDAGRVALVRTGLDDVTHGLAARAAPVHPSTQTTLAALRAWCDCPCDAHRTALDDAPPAPAGLRALGDGRETARDLLAVAVRNLLDAITVPSDMTPAETLELVLGGVLRYADDAPVPPCALVAWGLGPAHAGSTRSGVVPPDGARRYLADRVRRGEVSAQQLELAAYAGDRTACDVLRVAPPALDRTWVAGLARFGPDLALRALAELAGTSLATPLLRWNARAQTAQTPITLTDQLMIVLRSLNRWAATPTPTLRDAITIIQPFRTTAPAVALAAITDTIRAVQEGRTEVTDLIERVLAATDDPDDALASLRTAVAGWALE